ncbi:MAG: hypothetical protein ACRDS1_02530, partial [Pseudonocardiaceae bacterium]
RFQRAGCRWRRVHDAKEVRRVFRVYPDAGTRWRVCTGNSKVASQVLGDVMQTLIKVLGVIALLWIGFTVLGWVLGAAFTLLFWAVVIGAGVFIGSAAYAAVKSRSDRKVLK